ncbi:MAG: glycosyltransferase family 4 protein [Candidatus Competibacteraceae bacterium]|nr:glycosyltransferase family 4 protein [Candidatus Competibacteraceae bacterium]
MKYEPADRTPNEYLSQLRSLQAGYTLVYSDCFAYWPQMLEAFDSLPGRIGLATVGMNHMIERKHSMSSFLSKKGKIDIICHSDNYQDYMVCQKHGLHAHVIPNGVSLAEFKVSDWDFRAKYGVTSPKMVLCVSNFFPGKGQEHLVRTLDALAEKRKDFAAVFVATSVNFSFAKMLEDQVRFAVKKSKYETRFLKDIPREDTVQAFFAADVFAFPSQKEVAPLVAIEAQASHLPWVALPVGNMASLSGGRLVPFESKDERGYVKYSNRTYQYFAQAIDDLLNDPLQAMAFAENGYVQVEREFNWDAIADRYEVIMRGPIDAKD